ncbi:4-hydroxy-3-methylbut-2-enyl diphosphate reductase [Malonomonas rubra]|uniref:4-hydroxy-3-methylbut-2-enyl diphosphate reductase n=1 Tax=Malonomonas rubra TaxID=57040 RepID=UPI0026ED8446|nr:4-hydroxy-3-methylbut-2-enyl diphosphate reductase [Malonomonas rubra]
MEIFLAKSAGFCFGVKRATQMAFDASSKHEKIHSLGPLIHSPQVVEQLERQGVRVCKQVSEIPGGAVVVRSHGITAEEMHEIEAQHLDVIDATCPFVKKAQDFAAKLSEDGYLVVLVGEADHPEVQGIFSYAKGEAVVVTRAEEVQALPNYSKIGIVAQTTQPLENLQVIVSACLSKAKELRVYNTICDATTLRQREARQIAAKVDLMLVIGGFNSANTSRLARLCEEQQPCTHHIETAAQLQEEWFVSKERVGITAGASTPAWIIDEVLQRLKKISKRLAF